VRTTVPDPDAAVVPDLIRRDFTASAPNTRYVGDITQWESRTPGPTRESDRQEIPEISPIRALVYTGTGFRRSTSQ
jgi:hypothetical protein